MSAPLVIDAAGLVKQFGGLQVLRGIDLAVVPGRITGLVGPNAAGKSTLIKSILGLVRPDAGRLSVLGCAVNGDERYRRKIGYMPQAARFPDNLTGQEVLEMIRDLRGPTAAQDRALLDDFELTAEFPKRCHALSGGTRQKLSAGLAFLFRPDLLILDEPTAGLDPVASGVFKRHLLAARERGASVLLASHTMSELEELAVDIIFLLDGRVRFHGPVQQLLDQTGTERLEAGIATLMQSESAR